MTTIGLAVVFMFVAVFLLVVGLSFLSLIVAHIVGRIVPKTSEACSRYMSRWSTKRGFRNRLVVRPLGITFAIVVPLAVVWLPTHLVRRNITESARLVVRSGGNCHRDPEREHVLFETEDTTAIRRFAKQISLRFLGLIGGHCMCCGDMTFDLYQAQEIHYSFSLHHGRSIRIKGSSFGDKELSSLSRRRLGGWLARMGVTKALKEFREQEGRKTKAEIEALRGSAQPEDPPDPK